MNDISEKTPSYSCQLDGDQHCLTCADEAVAVRVVRLDREAGLALVEASDQKWEQVAGARVAGVRPPKGARPCPLWGLISPNMQEIDVTLVENVTVGDILLAHGGVAIARLEQGQTHEH